VSQKKNPQEYSGPMLDGVKPQYLTELKLMHCCEQCTHFDDERIECTFGFPTEPHLRASQMAEMERSGKMALCRLMEID
jgi:hypothetical protein